MKIIETEKAPAAIGPYSQAIISGNFIYTSGQIPIVPETGIFVDGTIKEQTEQVIKNIDAILSAARSSLENVVKTTCYLKNISDFSTFNSIYAKYFTSKPARSCVEVAKIPKDALVEIEVIAKI